MAWERPASCPWQVAATQDTNPPLSAIYHTMKAAAPPSMTQTFRSLKRVISDAKSGLRPRETYLTTGPKVTDKRQYHLYGTKMVSIGRTPARPTYVVGIIQQKHAVGLYFMPIYSHPKEFSDLSPTLRKMRTGKSCFNIRALTPEIEKEIGRMIRQGKTLYRRLGWI